MNVPFQLTGNSLVLSGSVTIRVASGFSRAALDLLGQNRDATLDCTNVEYLDGSILQQIAMLAAALKTEGKRLQVVGLPAVIAADFRLAGVSTFLGEGNDA